MGTALSPDLLILLLRLGVVVVLYLFLSTLVIVIHRELRAESRSHGEASPRGQLIVMDPGTSLRHIGHAFPLEPVTPVGRAKENAVVLDDEYVSASHATILLRDDRWWLHDGGSMNGTLLNGSTVRGEVPVHNGDEIQIGGVRLRLTF